MTSLLDPADMKVVDLKAELQKRDLSTKGLKAELVDRLRTAMEESTSDISMEDDKQEYNAQPAQNNEEQRYEIVKGENEAPHAYAEESFANGVKEEADFQLDAQGTEDRNEHAPQERKDQHYRSEREEHDGYRSQHGDEARDHRDERGSGHGHNDYPSRSSRRSSSRTGSERVRSSSHRSSERRRDEGEEHSRRREVAGYEVEDRDSGSRRDHKSDHLAENFLSQLGDRPREEGRDDRDSESRGGRRDTERRRRHRDYDEEPRDRRRHGGERERGDRDRGGERERGGDRGGDRHRDRGDRHRDSGRRDDRRGDRDRRRSFSPQRRSRSRSITPLHKRPKRLHNWDVIAPGFEHMTTAEAKETGNFPLPGQPNQTRPPNMGMGMGMSANMTLGGANLTGMDPGRAAMMMQHDLPSRPPGQGMGMGMAGVGSPMQSAARQARRLYVGQIPYGITEDAMMAFFNDAMARNSLVLNPGTPVVSAQINHEKNYAFVEFRDPLETTAAIAFDGIQFQGQSLKIRRPKDYVPVDGIDVKPPSIHLPGVISTNVPDGPNKIFVGGLPPYLSEDQVIELLKSFGELRAFNLVKDTLTGLSKGFAFCEYVDQANTDISIAGLNNMELGDKRLVVQRASVGSRNDMVRPGMTKPLGLPGAGGMISVPPVLTGSVEPSTVLQLLNMVTIEELESDDDYGDILEDVQDECSKFGTILATKIPRPAGEGVEVPGLGKIFVRYESIEQATAALRALAGRKFADRTVLASFVTEEDFETGNF